MRAHISWTTTREWWWEEHPQQGIAVAGAGQGIGGDAAGVVVHVGGDDARPEHGQEHEQIAPGKA